MNPESPHKPRENTWAWRLDRLARIYGISDPPIVIEVLRDLVLEGKLWKREGSKYPKKRSKEFYRYVILRMIHYVRRTGDSNHILAWEIELAKLNFK